MGSSAGVGAGVDLKDSEEVNIVLKLTKQLSKSLEAIFLIALFSGEGVSWKPGRWVQVEKQMNSIII